LLDFWKLPAKADELCARKVAALLASRQRVGSFIETSAVGIATRIIEMGKLTCGRQTFGHYKISKRIAVADGRSLSGHRRDSRSQGGAQLLPMRFTGDAERLKRFQQEARAVSWLIIQIS